MIRANAQVRPAPTRPAVFAAVRSVTLIGIVTADEKRVIERYDKQIWTVANPTALKGHAGKRVSITAKIGANDTVNVESIRVLTPKYPCCP